MHRHTKGFSITRTVTGAIQAAQDELQQALTPGTHLQLDDVQDPEQAAQLTAEEQQQNWLRSLQLQVPVVLQVSPENTILTDKDKVYGPPTPPVTREEPLSAAAEEEIKKRMSVQKNPFGIDGQFQMYQSAWKRRGCSRDFLRVGVPYTVVDTEEKLKEHGCFEMEDFSAGVLQRFDTNVARFKEQQGWKEEEIQSIRLVIVQLVEAFKLDSKHFRSDILQMSDYVARAFVDGRIDPESYDRVVGFSSLAGQTRLKKIEGGSAAKRAKKPEALQSLAFRMSRVDLLYPTMRQRALLRMFLGVSAAELPSSAHLLSPQDFHGMVSQAVVLPRKQKDAFVLLCVCEGQVIGSVFAVLPLQRLKHRSSSIPLTPELFYWENDLARLRDRSPLDQRRFLVTDTEAEILQKGELEELLSFRQRQLQQLQSAKTSSEFYQGLADIFPDVPEAVLKFAYYSIQKDGVVEFGDFLRRSHGLIRQSQFLTRVHYQLKQVIRRRERERAISQGHPGTVTFTPQEQEDHKKLMKDLRTLGLELTHPPLAKYWKFKEKSSSSQITDQDLGGFRYNPSSAVRDSADIAENIELDEQSLSEPTDEIVATNSPQVDLESSVDPQDHENLEQEGFGGQLTKHQMTRLELMGLQHLPEIDEADTEEVLNDSMTAERDPHEIVADRDFDMELVLEIMDEELKVLVPSYSDDPEQSSIGYGPNPARYSRYEDSSSEEEVEVSEAINPDEFYIREDKRVPLSSEDLQKMRNKFIWHSNRQWIQHLSSIGWPMDKVMAILERRHIPQVRIERQKLKAKREWWEQHMSVGYKEKDENEPPKRNYTINDFINGLANPAEQARKEFPELEDNWRTSEAHLVFEDYLRPFNRRTIKDDAGLCPSFPQTLVLDGEDHNALRAEVGTYSLWKTPYHGKMNPNYHLQDMRKKYCEKREGTGYVTPVGTLSKILRDICQPRIPGTYIGNENHASELHYQPTGQQIFEETSNCQVRNKKGELESRSLVSVQVNHTLLWSPTTTVPAAPSNWTMRMSDGDSHGMSSLESLAEFISTLAGTSRTWSYSSHTEHASLDTATGGRRSGVLVFTPGSPLRNMKTWEIQKWPARFGATFLMVILAGGGEQLTLQEGERMGLSTAPSRRIRSEQDNAPLVPDRSQYSQPGQLTYPSSYEAPSEVGTYRLERDAEGKRKCWTKVLWRGFGYSYHTKGFEEGDRGGQQLLLSCGQHISVFKLKMLLGLCYYLAASHEDMYERYLDFCSRNKKKRRDAHCFNFRFPRCLIPSKWATYVPLLAQHFGRDWRDELQAVFNNCEISGSKVRPFTEASFGKVVDTYLRESQVSKTARASDISSDSTSSSQEDTDELFEELYRVDHTGRLVQLQHDTSESDSHGRVGFDYGACFAHESQSQRPPQSTKHYSTKETTRLETL